MIKRKIIDTSVRTVSILNGDSKRKKGRPYYGLCLAFFITIFSVSVSYAQVSVSGTVTSAENGNTLPGVNVLEKGTSNGTSTDGNGEYEIEVSGPEAVLSFSYIGFEPREVRVGQKRIIDVPLTEDIEMLEDLVVVGYGKQDRKTLTSSVSSVSAEDIQNTPVAGTDQLMQGRAAGVQVSTNSGTPGGGIFVKIRGTTSISGSSDPLYIVDGIPIETGNFGLDVGGGTTSALADVDPSDIESIEVLKDASATAIYGARAANGVVLITTKRGTNAAPSIKVSSYYGFEEPVKMPDLVSGTEFEMLMNEAARNNGEPEPYADPQNTVNTDWAKPVFRTGTVRNYDLTISGGDETVKYAVSGSNYKQDGVVKPTSYDRSSARVNLDLSATDKLLLGTNISYSFSRERI